MELISTNFAIPGKPEKKRIPAFSEQTSYGVIELAENKARPANENSFDHFVPSQFLVEGWMVVIEGNLGKKNR